MKFFGILFLLVALVAAVFCADDKPGTLAGSVPPRCRQPIHRGDKECTEDLDRYGFDTNKGECIRFTYTGCGGNSNRFNTLAECRSTCA